MKFGLEQHIIDTFIKVFEANSKVDKAYMFGSRAKGNYRPDSDIDIAIKGQDLNTDDIIAMSVAFETHGITNKIDLLDYNNIKEPALKEHIDRVGIEFYSRWKKVKLQDVVSKLGDGLHGTPEYDINGEYYFINGNNLIDGKIVIKENTQRVTENEYLKYKKELNDRTILLGINGTIGNVALYNGEKCVLGKSACYFNVIDSVSKDYIKYVIIDKTFQSYIENFANGSTIMNVSLKVVREYTFSLPPIKEQISIASILNSLDEKIDLLHRQNKTLEQLAGTLFRQWFVEEAEESWIGNFGDLPIEIIDGDRGKNYPQSNEFYEIGYCLFLNAKNVTKNGFDFSQKQFINKEKDISLNSGKLKRNDIIITTRGTVGNIAFYNNLIDYENIRINSGMLIIRSSLIDPLFLYVLLTSKYFQDLIFSHTSGSAQPQLPVRDLKQIEIFNPPLEIIDKYIKIVKPWFSKVFKNQTQIHTLMQTCDNLLPKLLSGEVRVSDLN